MCIWAETPGEIRLSKKIDVEICGTEAAKVTGSLIELVNYDFKSRDTVINGYTYRTYDLNPLRARFSVDGSTCALGTDFEIYDSGGTTLHGLDTLELKVQNSV